MKNKERLLGRILSKEELEYVSGADTVDLGTIQTTPDSDGCADDHGNTVDCATGDPV